jgi:hypothetical protein
MGGKMCIIIIIIHDVFYAHTPETNHVPSEYSVAAIHGIFYAISNVKSFVFSHSYFPK